MPEHISINVDYISLYLANTGNIQYGSVLDSTHAVCLTSETAVNDNNWHHIAVTRSGDDWKLFLDGLLKSSAEASFPQINTTANLRIGKCYYYEQKCFFQGYIDEMRVSKGIARIDDPNDFMYIPSGSSSFTPPTRHYDENPAITSLTTTPDSASGAAPLTVDFEVTVIGGLPPYTYSWDFDGDSVEDSTDQNPSYSYTSEYLGNAVVTVTDNNSNSVYQNISIDVTELTTEDCYATYDFINNQFIVPCFEFDGVLYKVDMTLKAGDPYAFEVNSILAK